jgi:hypothetical protein
MEDTPHSDELVGAVRDFLRDEVMPELTGRKSFHARVAVNVLSIVERQLERGRAQEAEERQRLESLLGQEGDLEALNRELCRRIRTGELTLGNDALEEHLWQTTLDKVGVDQPKYSGHRAARERPGD